jgi:hypothetical protein
MIEKFLSNIYDWLIIEPLRRLYIYGPSVYNIGFWEGKEESEICQVITNHKQIFWEQNENECHTLITNRFQSFKTTVEVCIYFVLMFRLLNMLLINFSLKQLFQCCIRKQEVKKRKLVFIPSRTEEYITHFEQEEQD